MQQSTAHKTATKIYANEKTKSDSMSVKKVSNIVLTMIGIYVSERSIVHSTHDDFLKCMKISVKVEEINVIEGG